ncbi:MAG: 3',5'-cyclic-nucleotide phosphodiesterase [Candidatus Rokubacteria bacterium]|nr:3',5'-cyclic-nucleotide phosphodiesterase [Candidatus Rokubacteria bacterium]
MKLRVLGAFGAVGLGQRPAAFLLDERILIDGGTVTGALTVAEQLDVEHAIVSHAHLDHIAGLAYLAETLALVDATRPVTIASIEPVVETLRGGVFNDALWPDFARIPSPGAAVVRYRTLVADAEQRLGDLWVTPIRVNHTVPTVGFIVHDGTTGFVYSGDTGPTDELWTAARGLRGLRAIVLECAFPNRLHRLAEVARHLTPELLRRELAKLPADLPVWIYHVKPQFAEETAEELARIGDGRVMLLEQDKTYRL